MGPSGLNLAGEQVNEPMTQVEIDQIVQAYAQAAADAKRIGFDGIELHGAHGYLIDQFLWEKTNQRTDKYGGDMVARTRFAVEIIEACRRAVGPDFPIMIRLSQWKSSRIYSETRRDTRAARTNAHAARRGRSGYFPLFNSQVLGTRVRRIQPKFRRMGEEANGQAYDYRRDPLV